LVRAQVDDTGVQPVAISGCTLVGGVPYSPHDIVLWYSQHARVTATPSMTFVDGPSTQTGAEATEHRPSGGEAGALAVPGVVAVKVAGRLVRELKVI
jgi:hypothetical protein